MSDRSSGVPAMRSRRGGADRPHSSGFTVTTRLRSFKASQSAPARVSDTGPPAGSREVAVAGYRRARQSVVLPDGAHLTASSIPTIVPNTSDGRIGLDVINGRPDTGGEVSAPHDAVRSTGRSTIRLQMSSGRIIVPGAATDWQPILLSGNALAA